MSSNPFLAASALRHQGPWLIPIEAAHHDEMTNLSAASPQIQKQGHLRALKSREKRGGFGRLGCGGEDRPLVGLQHGKPGREILRMIAK